MQRKNINFKGLSKFQQKLSQTNGNAIAVAPTGSGKTEAAISGTKELKDMGGAK